jgi:hypothetical protein
MRIMYEQKIEKLTATNIRSIQYIDWNDKYDNDMVLTWMIVQAVRQMLRIAIILIFCILMYHDELRISRLDS